MNTDEEPPGLRPDESAPSAPIGRRFALVMGVVVLTGAVAGTVIGSRIVDLRALGIGTGTGASPTAVPNPPASAIASAASVPAASPSPSTNPVPANGLWATARSAADVYSDPGTGTVVDTVTAGQLVFVHSPATLNSDGDWYDVESAPNVRGWIASSALNLDAVSGTIEWCAVPSRAVSEPSDAQPFWKLSELMILGDVPLQTRLFSLAALGTADLAWGSRTQDVCAVLQITEGAVSSATFHAEIDTCAKPDAGAYGWGFDFGTAAVGPNGEVDQRFVMPSDSVLGYSQVSAGRVNPTEVVQLAGAGLSFVDLVACLHVNVTGGHDDTTVHTTVRADVCATVVSRGTETVVLRGIAPWDNVSHIEFTLNPGSEIDPAIVTGATMGMTIEADGGVDGAVRIRPTPVSGCEAATAS